MAEQQILERMRRRRFGHNSSTPTSAPTPRDSANIAPGAPILAADILEIDTIARAALPTPTAQIVTGSRTGGSAMDSLLTALENYGLIIDQTDP
jgi:hypothetical protein